jgi:hemerythrin-like domain-containing protein
MGDSNNQGKQKHYDLISLIELEQDTILEKLTELEKFAWRIEKSGLTPEIYGNIKSLNDYIFNDISRYFTLEEDLLLPELERVLPNHSSSAVMREEHAMILNVCSILNKMLEDKEGAEKEKDILQAEIISLVDVLQRHIHKKNHVLYHEVQSKIAPELQQEIYQKILHKINT